MKKADIPFISVTELSRFIASKEISPVEATEAYIDRIDDLDFKFNSYLTVRRKEALLAARGAELAIVQGNYLGPMHGIPVAIKDQLWTKGIRTTGGSRLLRDFLPDEDAMPLVNLKKAGAVLLGKTNLSELGLALPHRYSTPRNPWNLDRHPGFSSSGSATATAAFLCATSLGEDTGGSVRLPAARCGVVGLKPSWGLVSRHGVMSGAWSMDTIGPISRTVEDAAITLQTVAGHDPKDPHTWHLPAPDYRRALVGDIRDVRVGLIKEQVYGDMVEDEVREAVVNAAAVLAELGASVEEVSLPLTIHSAVIVRLILIVEAASRYREWVRNRLPEFGQGARIALLTASILPAQAYNKAEKLRSRLRREVLGALEEYDILAMPTLSRPAESIELDQPRKYISKESARLPYVHTPMFNAAGGPAITLPCGFSSDGLPIALELGGSPGRDGTVLKVAHAYEQATRWHTVRPPHA